MTSKNQNHRSFYGTMTDKYKNAHTMNPDQIHIITGHRSTVHTESQLQAASSIMK